MSGNLIVIMGIDGSGKTTLINNIRKCSNGIIQCKCMSIFSNPIFTKEIENVAKQQGRTRRECFSSELRSVIWKADLINNTMKYVIPELEIGNTVILDRYCLCNKVYSNYNNAQFLHMDKMLEALPKPDLGIYLDVDVDVALKRIEERNEEKAPYEKKDGLLQLKSRYEIMMEEETYPIVKIDANLSQREVTKIALENIFTRNRVTKKEKHINDR